VPPLVLLLPPLPMQLPLPALLPPTLPPPLATLPRLLAMLPRLLLTLPPRSNFLLGKEEPPSGGFFYALFIFKIYAPKLNG
jgi:hypothetical protein